MAQPPTAHDRFQGLAVMSRAEVARRLGLTREAVRMIEKRALRKLRRHPIIKKLQGERIGNSDRPNGAGGFFQYGGFQDTLDLFEVQMQGIFRPAGKGRE